MKKVSADTIGELTLKKGFTGDQTSPVPSAKKMIDEIFIRLRNNIDILTRQAAEAKKAAATPDQTSAFDIALAYATTELSDFKRLMKNMPKGFRLTPVLYSKVTREQKELAYSEFHSFSNDKKGLDVRAEFLKFLARGHADELRALGICEHGIQRMKEGQTPQNKNGQNYKVNIDHIVERSGAGFMALEKEMDPQMPKGSAPTYLVNHFSNFILLPEQVHEYKNDLNKIQDAARVKEGESKWVLMLVPEVDGSHSGYVAQPQDPKHFLHGVFTADEYKTKFKSTGPLTYRTLVAHKALRELISNEAVAELVRFNVLLGKTAKKGQLQTSFNLEVRQIPASKDLLETLTGELEDLSVDLEAEFNRVTQSGKTEKQFNSFLRFYQSKVMRDFCLLAGDVPVQEVAPMHEMLKEIDKKICEHQAKLPPPANDNAAEPEVKLQDAPKPKGPQP